MLDVRGRQEQVAGTGQARREEQPLLPASISGRSVRAASQALPIPETARELLVRRSSSSRASCCRECR